MAHGQKTGGRTTGTPNKVTSDVKSRIAAFIDERFDTITADLDQLEPKDRITAYLKFLEYILPKQREVKEQSQQRIYLVDDLDTPSSFNLTPEDVRVFSENFKKKYG